MSAGYCFLIEDEEEASWGANVVISAFRGRGGEDELEDEADFESVRVMPVLIDGEVNAPGVEGLVDSLVEAPRLPSAAGSGAFLGSRRDVRLPPGR